MATRLNKAQKPGDAGATTENANGENAKTDEGAASTEIKTGETVKVTDAVETTLNPEGTAKDGETKTDEAKDGEGKEGQPLNMSPEDKAKLPKLGDASEDMELVEGLTIEQPVVVEPTVEEKPEIVRPQYQSFAEKLPAGTFYYAWWKHDPAMVDDQRHAMSIIGSLVNGEMIRNGLPGTYWSSIDKPEAMPPVFLRGQGRVEDDTYAG